MMNKRRGGFCLVELYIIKKLLLLFDMCRYGVKF